MDLKEHFAKEFKIYFNNHQSLDSELRLGCVKMVETLKIDIDQYLKELAAFDNSLSDDSKQIDMLYASSKIILEPIYYQSASQDILEEVPWSSYIAPQDHNPFTNFDVFYSQVLYYIFIMSIIGIGEVDYDELLLSIHNYFYHWFIYKHHEARILEMFPDFVKEEKMYSNIFIDSYLHDIKPIIEDLGFEKILTSVSSNQNLLKELQNHVYDNDPDFKKPEIAFKNLYEELKKNRLFEIDYQSFRTSLSIKNDQLGSIVPDKVILSQEGNGLNIQDIGYIFYHFYHDYYKGRKYKFVSWIQSNFIITKKNGSRASMKSSQLDKILKPREVKNV
jgi:hypothetical protein